jgi:hypothetical protein
LAVVEDCTGTRLHRTPPGAVERPEAGRKPVREQS